MGLLIDYNAQWLACILAILAWACAFPVRRAVGWMAGVTIFWLVATSVNAVENPQSQYAEMQTQVAMAFRAYALDSVYKLFLVVGAMIYLSRSRNFLLWGREAVCWFSVASWLVTLTHFLLHRCRAENSCTGIIGNPSMSASLLVVMLPIVFMHWPKRLAWANAAGVVLAVAASKTSVPIGLLAVLVFTLSWRLIPLGLLAFLIGGYYLGPELLNSGDRIEMWSYFYSRWNEIWTGTGFGTFGAWSYARQIFSDVKVNGWWYFLHFDWFEMAITTGIVGLVLTVATYLEALWRLMCQVRFSEARSLLLYGTMMSFNYPLHLAPSAFFGCWLAVAALVRFEEQRG